MYLSNIYSSASLNSAILLQPIQLFISAIFISIFMFWNNHHAYQELIEETIKNTDGNDMVYYHITLNYPSIILVLGFLNLIICFSNLGCKINLDTENQSEVEYMNHMNQLQELNLSE